MGRICFVLVAGLDGALLARAGGGSGVLGGVKHRGVFRPPFPAVTSTVQATLSTGAMPGEHGIICNGLYTHGNAELQAHLDLSNHAEVRKQVSFWEQSNALLQRPRFWAGSGKRVAMLFWQNSIGAADILLTPKPAHRADGKTLPACFSSPGDLYGKLVVELGPFPLHNYWSPMAGLASSQWIVRSSMNVWREHKPDLQLVYVPHLDYNLQRQGPDYPGILKDLLEVAGVLEPLAEMVRGDGGEMVVAGDYGMMEVDRAVLPNRALREAGLLATRLDGGGKVVVDYEGSKGFVMADHQVGFVYVKKGADGAVREVLRGLEGVERYVEGGEMAGLGLRNSRAGAAVLVAKSNAWLAHDWWLSEEEKPAWQFGVDIHSKPGYDPRELFFDPARKCIAQDTKLVKGSHGLVGDASRWPVLLSDVEGPGKGGEVNASMVATWLGRLMV